MLWPALALAQVQTAAGIDLRDEGISQGRVAIVNCTGLLTCSVDLPTRIGQINLPQIDLGTGSVIGTLPVARGGTGSTAFTAGSIPFSNGTILTHDNANFFFDDTNNRLEVAGRVLATAFFDRLNFTGFIPSTSTLDIYSNNSFAINISSTQQVGIGVNTANRLLHVKSLDAVIRVEGTNLGSRTWDLGTGLASNSSFSIRDVTALVDRFMIDSSGNALIGTIASPSGTSGLIFADGTALSGMGLNTAGLYANDVGGTAEMFAIDEAGASTQISPHNFSLFSPDPNEEYPASYYSLQQYLGVEVAIDLFRLARLVQQQSGVQLIHRRDLPVAERRGWFTDQESYMRLAMTTYETWEKAQAQFFVDYAIWDARRRAFVPSLDVPTFTESAPALSTKPAYPQIKHAPVWLRQRLNDRGWYNGGQTLQTKLAAWCLKRGC